MRGRFLYLMTCLLLAGALAIALRMYMPPEAWDALRSTYVEPPDLSAP